MDLREIQRLHAQFASDSMTIDLPRQIAALPAPTMFENYAKSATLRSGILSGIAKSAPILRSCAKPVLVALVVALAGIGAAKLFRAIGASSVPHTSAEKTVQTTSDTASQPVAASDAGLRTIDASPARPVAVAPMLSANDVGGTSNIGLTAEQFRNSLGTTTTSTSGNAGVAKPAPPVSSEAKLAAVSPIRQSHREPETAHSVAASRVASAQPESRAASAASQPVSQASTATAATTATTAPAALAAAVERSASASGATTRSHGYRHHAARLREEQSTESETPSSASNKKPAPTTRAGSNEVQMF
ncbi:hypothetical protein [Caballeronia sp. J97]|uniref:hypothetical protein n=1 Tax=Caballeronia sp. J97 TaxID=2805429 RepID=UPI002AB1AA2C|nr:hypothetical protein [Caballeronia sp. J97]